MVKTSTKIIEAPITEEIIRIARNKAVQTGILKGSIRKGEGNTVGFIGKELVKAVLGIETGTNELVIDGKKYRIRAKETSKPPKESYDCSITEEDIKDPCDFYIFSRIKSDYSKGWILGYISYEEYKKKAVFRKKGEIDPSNNHVATNNCYNMKISELKNIKDLKN